MAVRERPNLPRPDSAGGESTVSNVPESSPCVARTLIAPALERKHDRLFHRKHAEDLEMHAANIIFIAQYLYDPVNTIDLTLCTYGVATHQLISAYYYSRCIYG